MSVAGLFRRAQRAWLPGHRVELLENGEQYYPAVFGAIAQARHEVMIETFILFEDKVGLELQRVLVAAAQRGVRVDLTVDGWGTPELSPAYLAPLEAAGVRVRAFDPHPRFLGLRLHLFRRMHRKIVLVDGHTAFVGGINFSADHLADFGPEAKQDYSVRIEGPLVPRMRAFFLAQIGQPQRPALAAAPAVGPAEAMFVIRDNGHNRDAIEQHYRIAIRAARSEVLIANAYFFPGYRLLRSLRMAARRGVRVRLILQGQPDQPIVKHAAGLLQASLVRAGVQIYEYCKRPLHGKVAVIDGLWATVGSSNLDPLSLALNLEANVMIRDRAFAAELSERLERLIREDCRRLEPDALQQRRARWRVWLETLAYHVGRHFPAWAGWLPAHQPAIKPIAAAAPDPATAAPAAAHADHGAVHAARHAKRPWYRQRWFGPTLGLLFLALIGWLVADHVAEIDWGQVRASVAAFRLPTLAAAGALVLASHLVYASYDLIGRRYVGHTLPAGRVLAVGLVSYAFNLNLGSLVGGFGFRLRLYSKLGLRAAQIARLIALSLVTNWSGWLLLAGALFAARQVAVPPGFPVSAGALQALGIAMVALPVAYAAACFTAKRREWHWRRHRFVLPSGHLALAQLGASSLNWALIGAIIWQLMPGGLTYGTVLATQLGAAVIAVPTHVPGGLGVVEAVFVGVLGAQVPVGQLLAGLLVYRALYYFVPLAFAAALHLALEFGARRRRTVFRGTA